MELFRQKVIKEVINLNKDSGMHKDTIELLVRDTFKAFDNIFNQQPGRFGLPTALVFNRAWVKWILTYHMASGAIRRAREAEEQGIDVQERFKADDEKFIQEVIDFINEDFDKNTLRQIVEKE